MSQYEPLYDSFHRNVPDRYVPTARMSVSASVYLPGSEVDFCTGQLKPDRQRRRRTQGKRLEAEQLERERQELEASIRREMDKGGVRISLRSAVLLMGVLIFVCGLALLSQQGAIANRQKEINRLERAIADCRSHNAALETQIAEASDSAKICYIAAQELNMIPSEAAEAIHLVAVDTRPAQTAKRQQQQNPQQLVQQAVQQPAAASASQAGQPSAIASN